MCTHPVSRVLMLTLSPDEIDDLIRPSTFHENKVHSILGIARRAVDEFGGQLPE